MSTLTIDSTITYQHIEDSPSRVSQHIGGTRSGKTYAILQWLIVQAMTRQVEISVVRKTIPSLKRTVIKDFKDILTQQGLYDTERFNLSDRVYTFPTGARISFINTDDAEKLRGVKSDILFIDEASEVDEESYFQLSIRTSGRIILAFNPTISPYHWIRQMEDVERYVTTYKDNPFLPQEMVDSIEALKNKNEKYWKIYGLGEYAPNERAIFQFDIVDEIPVCELVGMGMDFGYSTDPTTLIAVHRHDDTLYLRELLYDKGLVTTDIINKLKGYNLGNTEIWADSAEPRLIEEIYRGGFNIKPVKKGQDSVRFGIGVMQNFKLRVEKGSQNIINELYSYQWMTDKNGYVLDKPEGGLDHAIDAIRYVAMSRLSIKEQSKGIYAINIR